ncbi:MAG: hypothetical protein AABW48_02435 [Nanoarchaeota archaeon]
MKKRKVKLKDISNRTVLIMLVIVIIASVLSLAVYMDALNRVNERQAQCGAGDLTGAGTSMVYANKARGFVSLEILPPEESSE